MRSLCLFECCARLVWRIRFRPVKTDQIYKPSGALGDDMVWVIDLSRRIPENIKFKIIRRAAVGPFKCDRARGHDLLGVGQSDAVIERITARP